MSVMGFKAPRGSSYVRGTINVPPGFTPELLPFHSLHIHPTLVWPGLSRLHLLKLGTALHAAIRLCLLGPHNLK